MAQPRFKRGWGLNARFSATLSIATPVRVRVEHRAPGEKKPLPRKVEHIESEMYSALVLEFCIPGNREEKLEVYGSAVYKAT